MSYSKIDTPIYQIFTTANRDNRKPCKNPRELIDNQLSGSMKKQQLLEIINKSYPEYRYEELLQLLSALLNPDRLKIDELLKKTENPSREQKIFQIIIEETNCGNFFETRYEKLGDFAWRLGLYFKPNLKLDEKINYTAFYPNELIGACELWGSRETQEDYISCGSLNCETELSDSDWEQILKKTAADLQELATTDDEINRSDAGSTLAANIVIGNRIINANLGDSETFLVTVIDDEKKFFIERCTIDYKYPQIKMN